MKNFKIELNFIRKLVTAKFEMHMPVILEDNINEPVGRCEIVRTQAGEYHGYVNSSVDLNEELYFYYINSENEETAICIEGIQLLEKPMQNKTTKKLKQKIVN